MNKPQLKVFLFILLLAAAAPLFAQSSDLMPEGLKNMTESVLEIFTGPVVRTILIICLAGCGVAYGFNKDNEKMKRNIIAIAVAIAVVVGAQSIVGAVWDASK
jgi:type IV secretory pathway VirB2 component (pilin)